MLAFPANCIGGISTWQRCKLHKRQLLSVHHLRPASTRGNRSSSLQRHKLRGACSVWPLGRPDQKSVWSAGCAPPREGGVVCWWVLLAGPEDICWRLRKGIELPGRLSQLQRSQPRARHFHHCLAQLLHTIWGPRQHGEVVYFTLFVNLARNGVWWPVTQSVMCICVCSVGSAQCKGR